jgi:hypothetical protein
MLVNRFPGGGQRGEEVSAMAGEPLFNEINLL